MAGDEAADMKEETVVCPIIAAGTSSGVIYLLSTSSNVVSRCDCLVWTAYRVQNSRYDNRIFDGCPFFGASASMSSTDFLKGTYLE